MIVVITEPAEIDLQEIADYIASASPDRALTYFQELRLSCHGLGDYPERFPLVPGADGIRHRVHGRYLIFYRVRSDSVEVMRVLHGARDYRRILFAED